MYDKTLATANWDQGIAVAQEDGSDESETSVVDQDASQLALTVGKLFIIKGTNVSFYIPPTGVEVVPDEDGEYVRDALTLEMSEYCILLDQDGTKRYERGPQVVFPEPTEEFYTDDNGSDKFPPIELNQLQGLYLKANSDHIAASWPTLNEDGSVTTAERHFKEGEEFFITGKTHAIYYPCEEHTIITYGPNQIHYATGIPEGEGRYVMDRNTGKIVTRKGPDMMLLNPIDEVMVRRVLSDAESDLMYPGNAESLDYNRMLRAMMGSTPSARSGFVSEKDYEKNTGYTQVEEDVSNQARKLRSRSRGSAGSGAAEFTRSTEYTKPRTITLDTKYDGVPKLVIWTGYAVMVVKANGERRVEVGPKTILLDYDETVEPLHLSTGKPKTTDNMKRTGYLRVSNNKVSDIIAVETADNIPVQIKVSYRVNFTGEPEDWFNVENYVKFLCDHARSKLKGAIKKIDIESFYNDSVAKIRDTILGQAANEAGATRPGLKFDENGMHVTDVEVLDVTIKNQHIADLLVRAQHETITNNIEIDRAKKELEVVKEREAVDQAKAQASFETQKLKNALAQDQVALALALALQQAEADLKREEEALKVATAQESVEDAHHTSDLARRKSDADLEREVLDSKTAAVVKRFEAVQENFGETLLAISDAQTLEKVAEALGPMRFIGGENVVDALNKVFVGTPFAEKANQLAQAVASRGRHFVDANNE